MSMSVRMYQYFGSGAGIRELSNFSACQIRGTIPLTASQVYVFPSVEHYYVAHLCQNPAQITRLAMGGDLASFETGMPLVYPRLSPNEVQKKITYWQKSNMIGIIAKMYGKMINRKEKPSDPQEWEAFRQIWIKMLTEKYTQNAHHRQLLLSTVGTILVEFDRMATPNTTWAGRIVGGIDRGHGLREGGQLIRQNYMGFLMTEIRDMQSEAPTPIPTHIPTPTHISTPILPSSGTIVQLSPTASASASASASPKPVLCAGTARTGKVSITTDQRPLFCRYHGKT